MARLFADYAVFWRQVARRYRTTGAVLPSGRPLASTLCHYVRQPAQSPRQILEVGPGTGPVTERLASCLRPGDRLTLVEINDEFVQRLERRLSDNGDLRTIREQTTIVHGPVEDVAGHATYDLIISGLPLNNFTVEEVERILGVLARLLKPDGVLSFFEYIAIRHAKLLISGPAERRRVKAIGRLLEDVTRKHQIRRDAVWLNVTPAWVHHLRFGSST